MNPRVYYSRRSSHCRSAQWASFFREAVRLLFPAARLFDALNASLGSDHSFFLREGENIYWVEVVSVPFSRNEISDYLTKARQIQSSVPSGLSGILAAPHFEAGVQELLELIRIPVRLFRYQETFPLTSPFGPSVNESALWIEELTPSASEKSHTPASASVEDSAHVHPSEGTPSKWNRLSREELREFIQLELELASQR